MYKVISDVSWMVAGVLVQRLRTTVMHCHTLLSSCFLPARTGFLTETLSPQEHSQPSPSYQTSSLKEDLPSALTETTWCPLMLMFSFSPAWRGDSRQPGVTQHMGVTTHWTGEGPEICLGGSAGGACPPPSFVVHTCGVTAVSDFLTFSANLGGVSVHKRA